MDRTKVRPKALCLLCKIFVEIVFRSGKIGNVGVKTGTPQMFFTVF